MKSLPVFALPEVEADLRAAIEHYDSWRSDGAAHVQGKYEETVGWITWNPESFPKKYGPTRRAILKQSYFIVYFVIEEDRTVILAVLDGRREPKAIRNLLIRRRR